MCACQRVRMFSMDDFNKLNTTCKHNISNFGISKFLEHSKIGPSKICGRQPSKNFTWSTHEYFVPFTKS